MRPFLRQNWALWLAALLGAWACTSSARMARAQELELPVPRAVIYPGEVVSDELLGARAFIAPTVARAAVHESREALIGKVARRTLMPGKPTHGRAIRDPYLVTQGKTAMVVFEYGGLTITTNAVALQNGGLDD